MNHETSIRCSKFASLRASVYSVVQPVLIRLGGKNFFADPGGERESKLKGGEQHGRRKSNWFFKFG